MLKTIIEYAFGCKFCMCYEFVYFSFHYTVEQKCESTVAHTIIKNNAEYRLDCIFSDCTTDV